MKPGAGSEASVIGRLKIIITTLDVGIPQDRRMEAATESIVFIDMVGRVDESAVKGFAGSVLKTGVVVKRLP